MGYLDTHDSKKNRKYLIVFKNDKDEIEYYLNHKKSNLEKSIYLISSANTMQKYKGFLDYSIGLNTAKMRTFISCISMRVINKKYKTNYSNSDIRIYDMFDKKDVTHLFMLKRSILAEKINHDIINQNISQAPAAYVINAILDFDKLDEYRYIVVPTQKDVYKKMREKIDGNKFKKRIRGYKIPGIKFPTKSKRLHYFNFFVRDYDALLQLKLSWDFDFSINSRVFELKTLEGLVL